MTAREKLAEAIANYYWLKKRTTNKAVLKIALREIVRLSKKVKLEDLNRRS